MTLLSLHNVTVNVPGLSSPILSIPHFYLQSSQQIALMGPSGCGKSTFLNIICGLLKPSSGNILWGNQDLTMLSTAQCDHWRFQNIGIIMQDFYLTNGLTALDNVLLPSAFRNWHIKAALQQRAKYLLQQLKMPHFDTNVEHLSRGEKQRVAIARALLHQPKIIIADEPTASLDKENSQIISQLLCNISTEENCTLIVATHDLFLASQLKRKIQLENGIIVSDNDKE
ncbi:putative ABC transporter ATP-binding protein YbbA [Gallibacterium anatis UMN179]|uniref:Putative ABC transporter ATP-binding protein YbbA n=1 Tax=Gallibacterium anatis (strain UMN179) TaxID=1005058 RepID=F4HCE5_GALAU|nr:ATP-binding cassette domain-containing protein [Gallibacterium anatis]AEC16492.1 putative ABC transporter ATP-binding protein YbbA [Gallibacterium anatis UMN179]